MLISYSVTQLLSFSVIYLFSYMYWHHSNKAIIAPNNMY